MLRKKSARAGLRRLELIRGKEVSARRDFVFDDVDFNGGEVFGPDRFKEINGTVILVLAVTEIVSACL